MSGSFLGCVRIFGFESFYRLGWPMTPEPCVVSGYFLGCVRVFGFESFFRLGRVLSKKIIARPRPWIIADKKLWRVSIRCNGRVKLG